MSRQVATFDFEVEVIDFPTTRRRWNGGPFPSDEAHAALHEVVEALQAALRERGFEIARTGYGVTATEVLTDLEKTERLREGDACEFEYPARKGWRPGVVVRNGGTGYWYVRDDASGEVSYGLYIEHVRAPGTDPWGR